MGFLFSCYVNAMHPALLRFLGLPAQGSSYAHKVDFDLLLLHAGMAAMFIIWAVLMAFLLIRYRRKEGRQAIYESTGGAWALAGGVAIVLFELVIIVTYSIPTWSTISLRLPDEKSSNVIAVVAEQFAWNVHYPGPDGKFGRRAAQFVDSGNVLGLDPGDPDGKDDVVTLNELHAPLGKPTLVYLTSKDVIHSFFIPAFRVKRDAVPGMVSPLWFEPILEGRFTISCAQLCGIGHATMQGVAITHPAEEFESWLKEQSALKDATD